MALFYEESHTSARETILWLHGAGVSGWVWRPQIDRLPDFHGLVPDLPEHGRSLRERPFAMAKVADQLARLIEQHAHYSRAHVVGHGLGAMVAVELLARFPDRVGRAVLTGALLRSEAAPDEPLDRLLAELSFRAALPFRNLPFRVRARMRALGIPERYRAEFAADTRRLTRGALWRAVRLEERGLPLPEGLAHSPVPTLVVVGTQDRPAFRQSAEVLVGVLPSARGAVLEGHAWSLEEADRYAAMVRAWLHAEPLPPGLAPLNP